MGGGQETAFLVVAPGVEALAVEAESAAPAGCDHAAGCCAGPASPLWTFCWPCDPGSLHWPPRPGGSFCS